MLSNLAAQETLRKDMNNLTMEQITIYMKKQFDPKRFVVSERSRFWNEMKRRPGESIQELATAYAKQPLHVILVQSSNF